jgi:toxin ParE1/3/4
MPTYTVRAQAWREVSKDVAYLEERAGIEVAERFLVSLRATWEQLAAMPHLGPVYGFQRPGLRRIRQWHVRGFENWLIFYLPKRNGVDIVRVIHGSRDIETAMGTRP